MPETPSKTGEVQREPESPANNSTESGIFEPEDELPLSKLIPQVKAERAAAVAATEDKREEEVSPGVVKPDDKGAAEGKDNDPTTTEASASASAVSESNNHKSSPEVDHDDSEKGAEKTQDVTNTDSGNGNNKKLDTKDDNKKEDEKANDDDDEVMVVDDKGNPLKSKPSQGTDEDDANKKDDTKVGEGKDDNDKTNADDDDSVMIVEEDGTPIKSQPTPNTKVEADDDSIMIVEADGTPIKPQLSRDTVNDDSKKMEASEQVKETVPQDGASEINEDKSEDDKNVEEANTRKEENGTKNDKGDDKMKEEEKESLVEPTTVPPDSSSSQAKSSNDGDDKQAYQDSADPNSADSSAMDHKEKEAESTTKEVVSHEQNSGLDPAPTTTTYPAAPVNEEKDKERSLAETNATKIAVTTLETAPVDPKNENADGKDKTPDKPDDTAQEGVRSIDASVPKDGAPSVAQDNDADPMDVDGRGDDGKEQEQKDVESEKPSVSVLDCQRINTIDGENSSVPKSEHKVEDESGKDQKSSPEEEEQQPQQREGMEASAMGLGMASPPKHIDSDGTTLAQPIESESNKPQKATETNTEGSSSNNNSVPMAAGQDKGQLPDSEPGLGNPEVDRPSDAQEMTTGPNATSGNSKEMSATLSTPIAVGGDGGGEASSTKERVAMGEDEKSEINRENLAGDVLLETKDRQQTAPDEAQNEEVEGEMKPEDTPDESKNNTEGDDSQASTKGITKEEVGKDEEKSESLAAEVALIKHDDQRAQPPIPGDANGDSKMQSEAANDENMATDSQLLTAIDDKGGGGNRPVDDKDGTSDVGVEGSAKNDVAQAAVVAKDTSDADTTKRSPGKEEAWNEAKTKEQEEEKPAKKRPLYEWPIEEESDIEDESVDVFAVFQSTTNKKRRKTKKKIAESGSKGGSIKVVLSIGKGKDKRKTTGAALEQEQTQPSVDSVDAPFVMWDDNADDGGLEDSLRFFQEPHEDQDPVFMKWQTEKADKKYADELRKIEEEDQTGRKQIEDLITAQLQDKQASTDRSVEKYRARTTAEKDKDMQKLHQMYKDKLQSSNDKINQGIQVLRKRHQQELEKVRQQHRQQIQQRRIPEHMANAEWSAMSQRLGQKQQRQLQDFTAKGEEVKKRCETEHNRDREKLRSQYEKRMRDIEANRQSIYARMYSGFQQLRQRYIKRHNQKISKKKDMLAATRPSTSKSESATSEVHRKKGKDEKLQSPRDIVKSAMEDKVELRPPSPIKTFGEWVEESPHEKSGAATRHKHRKGVLSQINKQLAVEIHNEGIWISAIVDKKSDGSDGDANKSGNNNSSTGNDGNNSANNKQTESGTVEEKEFIPWGFTAREILESIICGEIPRGFGRDRFDFGETTAMYGCHVRCVMTDLRTSDVTASLQRAEAAREQEDASFIDLENKIGEVAKQNTTTENALAHAEQEEKECSTKVEEAVKDVEKSKRNMQNFRTKFSRYLGPDGNPIPSANPSDRQKLMKASMQYKNIIENMEKREKAARKALGDAKANTQKHHGLVKQAQKAGAAALSVLRKKKALLESFRDGSRHRLSEAAEAERASTRVHDVIGALKRTADKRREQLNQKRTSSTSSSWVQNLPGLPGALRKSLWHKMHRRRQQIVLRPSHESLVSDLRESVLKKIEAEPGRRPSSNGDWKEDELVKAEQLFLLSVHPVPPNKVALPSVPSSSSNDPWAEPGWHLLLEVSEPHPASLLPCAPSFPVLQRNLSELHSAPGRQAAALIRTTHLRSLAAPLSVVATATSLAETNPGIGALPYVRYDDNDPLNISTEAMEMGYKFAVRAPVKAAPSQPRKKSVTSRDPGIAAAAAVVKKQTALQESNPPPASGATTATKSATTAMKSTTTATKAAPKTEKRRRGSQGSRPTQRRKSESKQHAPSSASSSVNSSTNRNVVQQPVAAAARGSFSRQASNAAIDQQSPASSYNQFMAPMPAPAGQPAAAAVQQRATYQQQLIRQQQQQQQQFQNPHQQQMAQLRMMQHQTSPQGQQMAYNPNPHGMQQMQQQFFAPMPQQGFPQQPMAMPGRVVGPPGGPMPPMNVQPNNQMRRNPPGADDQTDPLFMMKDM